MNSPLISSGQPILSPAKAFWWVLAIPYFGLDRLLGFYNIKTESRVIDEDVRASSSVYHFFPRVCLVPHLATLKGSYSHG